MSTITPVPDVILASEFPTLEDRQAGTWNQAAAAWANSENAMSIRNREIAISARDNALSAEASAQLAAQVSMSNAHFRGAWDQLSGPLAVPATVFDNGRYWTLLRNIPDVAASRPDPYSPDWAVTGATSIDAFGVGDYLTTARYPGPAWLRRNGAAYPKSAYPALAALMPTIPASFAFTPVSTGIPGDISQILEYAGALVMWPDTTDSIYISEDAGETWEAVQVVPSARRFCTGCVFQGKLLIGLNNGAYLQFESPETFGVKSITGITTQDIHLAASGTAVIAAGQNPSSPSGTQILRRSTNLSTWTTPSMTGAMPVIQGMTNAGGLFLTVSGGSTAVALSVNDGASFTRIEGAALGVNPATLGNATQGLRTVIDDVLGVGSHWRTPNPGSQLFPIALTVDGTTGAVTVDPDLNAIGAGLTVFDIVFAEDKYVIFVSVPGGVSGRAGYSFDMSGWTMFSLPEGHAVRRAAVSGPWVVTVGWNGSVMRGRFINSDSFRVPSDDPQRGWIKAIGN